MATVLIVDDLELNLRVLAKVLASDGHRTVEARDGFEALVSVKEDAPDLIITDLHMPNMGGVEFLKALRADKSIKQVPVIIASATFSLREAVTLKDRYGANAVLMRPTEPKLLLKTVRTLLDDAGIVDNERAVDPPEPAFDAAVGSESDHLAHLQDEMGRATRVLHVEIGAPADARDATRAITAESADKIEAIGLRLTTLVGVGMATARLRDPDALLAYACGAARDICLAEYAALSILDAHGHLVRFASVGYATEAAAKLRDELPSAPLGRLLETQEVLMWDAERSPSSLPMPQVHPPVKSFASVRLGAQQNARGWLYVANSMLGERFTDLDKRMLGTIAAQVAIAYENIALTEHLERTLRVRTLMSSCDRILVDARTEGDLIDRMCRAIVEQGEFAGARIEHRRSSHAADAAAGAIVGPPALEVGLHDGARRVGILQVFSSNGGVDAEAVDALQELGADISFGLLALETDFARRQSERSLGRTEQQLARVLGSVESVVWSASGLDLVQCNSAVEDVYGRPAADFQADRKLWRTLIHPGDRVRADAATLHLDSAWKTHEYRIARPDGTERWLRERVRAVRDAETGTLRIEGVTSDVTDQRQAAAHATAGADGHTAVLLQKAEELRVINRGMHQHNEQLRALNTELESFNYTVSHDLRAPVRSISGFASLLEERLAETLDDESRRFLSIIQREALRMGELIDDLLALSHLGRELPQHADVDMTAVARSVVDNLLAPLAPDARPTVVIEVLPRVQADRSLIRQVWTNLIANAIKYSAKTTKPVIVVRGAVDGDAAIFEVEDNGVGFDMQYYDRLFGVFARLHAPSEFPGTGVGLAIVQRIIARHGGRVWAHGYPNRGATFSFALPRKQPSHDP
jgi:PAS domain S-box-containing protein